MNAKEWMEQVEQSNKPSYSFDEVAEIAANYLIWIDEQKPHYVRLTNEDAILFFEYKELKSKKETVDKLTAEIENFRLKWNGIF